MKTELDDGFQSRKLIFALLLVILAWTAGQVVVIDKFKLMLDFTEVIFGIYAGANVGNKVVSAWNMKKTDKPAPVKNPDDDKGD